MPQIGFAENTDAPWKSLKIGNRVNGMKVTYLKTDALPMYVIVEGTKTVTGVVECTNSDYGYLCHLELTKASQKKLPWNLSGGTLECLIAEQDACDTYFAPGKKYRVTMKINWIRDSRCTECDPEGAVLRMEKLMLKREVKK